MPGRLTLAAARRIALAAQGVGRPRPSVVTMRHLQTEIDRVAQFQIDSVNVAVRAHYMPLFTRLGAYDVDLLRRASETSPRRVFEYWGHAASLIDARLYPALRWRMERLKSRPGRQAQQIMAERPQLRSQILAHMDTHGPVTPRALSGDEVREHRHWGWNWSQAKHVLEYLFDIGEVAVAGRTTAFERLYDRSERVLPPALHAASGLQDREAHDLLVGRAARALGVADLEALSAYSYLKKDAVRAAIARLEARGELEPVSIAGVNDPHWLWHEARRPRSWEAAALVSPFDSLAFERERLEKLFGTRYRIEIYLPAQQRRYGYYVYLFFAGDAPAARVDLKADRTAGVLRVRSAWLEPGSKSEPTARMLAHELVAMAGWLGLGSVHVDAVGTQSSALAKCL